MAGEVVTDHDFEAGAYPVYNNLGPIDGWTYYAPSTIDAPGQPLGYHADETNINLHKTTTHALPGWGTNVGEFTIRDTDMLDPSQGRFAVYMRTTGNDLEAIKIGQEYYYSWGIYWPTGYGGIQGLRTWEVHDQYLKTDTGLIGACIAPHAVDIQETYLITDAAWYMRYPANIYGARPANLAAGGEHGHFYYCRTICYGNGTPNGANPGSPNCHYTILQVPLEPFVFDKWVKFVDHVIYHEDEAPGLVETWCDVTSGNGALVLPATPQFTWNGPTMKWTTGSADGVIKQWRGLGMFANVGLYRGTSKPGAPGVKAFMCGQRNRLTKAAAIAAFGGSTPVTPPTNSLPPSQSGTAQVGQTLTVAVGNWGGSPAPQLTLQWYTADTNGNNPQPIQGATNFQHVIPAGEAGFKIGCNVLAQNAGGQLILSTPLTSVVIAAGVGLVKPTVSSHISDFTNGALSKQVLFDVGPNAKIVQVLVGDAHPQAINTIKIAGQDLTRIHDSNFENGMSISIWRIINPPVGLQKPVDVAWSSVRTAVIIVQAIDNCDTSSFGPIVPYAHSNASPPTIDVPSTVATDLILSFICAKNSNTAPNPFTEGTLQTTIETNVANAGGQFTRAQTSSKTGIAGTTNMQWSISAADSGYAAAALALHGVAIAGPPIPQIAPIVNGTARVNSLLTVTQGTYGNTDGSSTYTYIWQADLNGNQQFNPIPGANANNYTVEAAYAGCTVRVVETVHASGGNASANSTAVGPISVAFSTNYIDDAERPSEDPIDQAGQWANTPIQTTTTLLKLENIGVGYIAGRVAGDSTGHRVGVSQADFDLMVQMKTIPVNGEGFSIVGRVKNPNNGSTMAAYYGVWIKNGGFAIYKVTAGSSFVALTAFYTGHSLLVDEWLRFKAVGTALSLQWGVDNGDGTFTWQTHPSLNIVDSAVTGNGTIGLEMSGGSARLKYFATAVVSASPTNNVLPTISDTSPQIGDTLTVDLGGWDNIPTSFAVQWAADGADIPLKNARSLFVDGSLQGKVLTVRVRAANSIGFRDATSAPTSAVLGLAPELVTAPSLVGLAVVDGTLVVNVGGWLYSPLSYDIVMYRGASPIAGATGTDTFTYHPNDEDVGSQLKVQVTANNAQGSTPAFSTFTATIPERPHEPPPPPPPDPGSGDFTPGLPVDSFAVSVYDKLRPLA